MSYESLTSDRLGRWSFPDGLCLRERFRVKRRLAETALSIVYLAEDLHAGQHVIVKQLAPRLDDEDLDLGLVTERFEREGELLRRLQGSAVPRHYASFQYGSQPVIVMERIRGTRLDRVLGRSTGMKEALGIGMALCQAVTMLHEQNWPIVHGDLKPANIMIEPQGRAVLLDLGLARVCTPGAPYEEPAGTPPYTPPEQWRGERLDPRSDIYALGVVLRELFGGTHHYSPLGQILERAMAQRRQDRYHSASALWRALSVIAEEHLGLDYTTNERFARYVRHRSNTAEPTAASYCS